MILKKELKKFDQSLIIARMDFFLFDRADAECSKSELQQRFFKDFGGEPLILDPWFSSYFQGKQQTNLHGIV